eukprot:Clim_evm19s11 gene=Clim_evmTU19s11
MYIKQVIINNFKSYKDVLEVEPFSEKFNVVVGRNGSGKSNFFSAIRFVLSDAYNNLRSEERQALLHEGAGAAAMSAYVEIVFDNSDGRLPVDKQEVTLRRSIGAKKDEYFLDKRHITKQEVENLLEAAGFSRSNPYYIVQQGKINALATAKDADRLDLLKEVAGTTVYDQKRENSMRILDETEAKRAKIEGLAEYIEERLGELNAEKDELDKYIKLERDKSCIEYVTYKKELAAITQRLGDAEFERTEILKKGEKNYEESEKLRQQIAQLEIQKSSLQDNIGNVQQQLESTASALDRQLKERTKVSYEVSDIEEREGEDNQASMTLRGSIRELDNMIDSRKRHIAQVEPKLQSINAQEAEQSSVVRTLQQKRDVLFAKQSRNSQFKNKADRDQWLSGEIKSLQQSLAEKNTAIAEYQTDISTKTSQVEENKQTVKEIKDELQTNRKEVQRLGDDLKLANSQYEELRQARQDLQEKESDLMSRNKESQDQLEDAERNLERTTTHAVILGLRNVKRIVQEHNIQGYHGPLIELISCSDEFATAAEVSGGGDLFNVVVDSDDVAARILELMGKEDGRRRQHGRVTFMPLNRLRPRHFNYPNASDAIPLIKKLKYDRKIERAVHEVFGRTLICRNLEIASKYVKSHDLDGITLDGDRHNRKGAITGGHTDFARSRIACSKRVQETRVEHEMLSQELEKLQEELMKLSQKTTNAQTSLQKLRQQREALQAATSELMRKMTNIEDSVIPQLNANIEQQRQVLEGLSTEVDDLSNAIGRHTKEMGSEMSNALTAEEQQELNNILEELQSANAALLQINAQKESLDTKKMQLAAELNNNYIPRRNQQQADLNEIEMRLANSEASIKRDELQRISNQLSRTEQKRIALSKKSSELDAKLNDGKKTIERLRERLAETENEEGSQSKLIEKNSANQQNLQQRKEELQRSIRDLGPLQSDYKQYQNTSVENLHKKLQHVNERLKKYSHVNKKAIEQFKSFSQQREDIISRKEELDEADGAIHELIQHLDYQKDEAITRTFKQVAKNFSDCFAELVPGGKAEMVMQRRALPTEEEAEDGEEADHEEARRKRRRKKTAAAKNRVDSYVGVAVKISFTGRNDETQMMQQLSGGQKTLVALTLIFAIQRCDPAPFYLFDEIDAALDQAHRTSVAAMIQRQSDNAQFITTTFRPEMLQCADNFYGITFRNKISHIDCITRDNALAFIEDEARDHAVVQNNQGRPSKPALSTPSRGGNAETPSSPAMVRAADLLV